MDCPPAPSVVFSFLKKEDGGYLLQEDGSKIVIGTEKLPTNQNVFNSSCPSATKTYFEYLVKLFRRLL